MIILLSEKDAPLDKVGGKAKNLADMFSAGFPVPPAFCVTVDSYFHFVETHKLIKKIKSVLKKIDYSDDKSLFDGCEKIRNMFLSSEIPETILQPVISSAESIDGKYFAVRSSAVAEDMEGASFAGQQDTYLNVSKENLGKMILKCWASYWNDRAVKYRHDAGIQHTGTGIAVVIQKMVDSEISGVMFTSDPVSGTDDIVIESSWGLGESIASGIVTPDRYVVSRDMEIKDVSVRNKDKGYFLREMQNALIDIEPEKAGQRCASDSVLKDIASLGLQLEAHFGMKQDVEWAMENGKIYLLQSRPVTTTVDSSERDGILWSRAYGDEYWADATTPLFYSTMGTMLVDYVNHEGARKMGYKDLVDTKLIKLHKSRVYFNTDVLKCVFGHYPRFIRSKELLNYFPVSMQENILDQDSSIFRALLSQVRVFFVDHDGMLWKTDKAYKRWASEFLKLCDTIDPAEFQYMDDSEIKELYDKVVSKSIKHYRLIRYGMVSHSIASNLIIKNWLADWLNDDGSTYAGLIAGLEGNKTVATNIGFYDISIVIRDNPDIKEKIDSSEPEEFLEWMDYSDNKLKPVFDAFMKEFGHRSNTREIMVPRWKENRSYVLGVARLLADSDTNLRELEIRRKEERISLEFSTIEQVKKKKGFLHSKLFSIVLKIAQTYLIFRENQRFYLDHILFTQRQIFLEIGDRLKRKGVIEEGIDVFFLYENEVFSALAGELKNMKKEVSERKSVFMKYKDNLPPKFLLDGADFDDTYVLGDDVTIIGAASSPGYYKGVARVVANIENLCEIKAGEILVTSNTDPGWTAVFSRLGALVTETGGILSHGAVVSREYKIPAVTAVKDATTIIKTGQTIIVDGNNGKIYIEEEKHE